MPGPGPPRWPARYTRAGLAGAGRTLTTALVVFAAVFFMLAALATLDVVTSLIFMWSFSVLPHCDYSICLLDLHCLSQPQFLKDMA